MSPHPSAMRDLAAAYVETYGIILTSRVRLARNLRDLPFPERASPAIRAEVCRCVREAARPELPLQQMLAECPPLERQRLFEEHLISRTMMEGRPESALCLDSERRRSVMINEEDHVRLQVLCPGLSLREAWAEADALDDVLEQHLDYAFSPTLGYLTSCPTNVGTGLRASVLMHLPGLVLMEEIGPIINGLAKIGLAVRGRWGEGTAALGHMFQISNQLTLGMQESRIVADLEAIVKELAVHEQNARERLKREKPVFTEDLTARALGILTSARQMTAQEALERLSEVRLGIALHLIPDIPMKKVDELLLAVQPAHLQLLGGREMPAEERDVERARRLRAELGGETKPFSRKTP